VTATGDLVKVMLQGESTQAERMTTINDDQMYTIATSDFVAAQAKKVAGDAIVVKYQKMLVRDILIDYIKDHGLEIE
jgi:hypothetical protein